MTIKEFARLFPEKMKEVTGYLNGEGVKTDMGRVALDHIEQNFAQEGYVDEALNPWQEVARRKPDSPWYGHSGQLGKPSGERTQAPILQGETRELSRATRMEFLPDGVRIVNSTPYAQRRPSVVVHVQGEVRIEPAEQRFTVRSPSLCPNVPLWGHRG